MAFTHAVSTNNYGPARLIVATSAANGTHTTLASAMADAVSGDTIFLRDSVTENVTLTAGVNITAWTGGTLNVPTITGTLTMSTAGTCNISGIKLQTNSAALLAVTGSAASIVNLNNCYLNMTNSTGISYTSSNSSSNIYISNCRGDLGTTGIAIYSMTSTGTINFLFSNITNSGSSTTASSNSAGSVLYGYTTINSPLSTSSTGLINASYLVMPLGSLNTTAITSAGTGSISIQKSVIASGTASCISIGSGTTGVLLSNQIDSTNTNAITGAGSVSYADLVFSGTSQTVNTTTQSSAGTLKGSTVTAPTAGFLGERIESSVTAVATTSNTPKNLTSISLTPGIWDISCSCTAVPTGGTGVMTVCVVGISTTSATFGTAGVDYFQTSLLTGTSTALSGSVPSLRATLTATTTYYCVIQNVYTSTTCPTNGRLSATRVG